MDKDKKNKEGFIHGIDNFTSKEGSSRTNVTPELIRRTDSYNKQWFDWYWNKFDKLTKDERHAFRERHKEKFPRMGDPNVADFMAVKPYFTKCVYKPIISVMKEQEDYRDRY